MRTSTLLFPSFVLLATAAGCLVAAGPGPAPTMRTPRAMVNRVQSVYPTAVTDGQVAGVRFAGAQSTNWAGWVDTGASYRSITAAWTQPAVTCSAGETSYSSFWIGLDGDGSSTVEQAGTAADCVNGAATYSAWYEFFPANPVGVAGTVRPGDVLHASVAHLGSSSAYTITLTDNTAGWSHTVTGNVAAAKNASAEVIAEAPAGPTGQALPLARFGRVAFSAAMVNGAPLGAVAAASSLTMASAGKVKASVSPLSGQTAFTVTWVGSGA